MIGLEKEQTSPNDEEIDIWDHGRFLGGRVQYFQLYCVKWKQDLSRLHFDVSVVRNRRMSWCQGVDCWIAVSPVCLSWELLFLESPLLSIWRELAKGGTEREAASITLQVAHRRDDRLMARTGRTSRSGAPRLWHCGSQQPPSPRPDS